MIRNCISFNTQYFNILGCVPGVCTIAGCVEIAISIMNLAENFFVHVYISQIYSFKLEILEKKKEQLVKKVQRNHPVNEILTEGKKIQKEAKNIISEIKSQELNFKIQESYFLKHFFYGFLRITWLGGFLIHRLTQKKRV